jgi:aminopeptidase N
MPRLRQAVAQKVADRLFAVEAAIDIALARAAELAAALPQARTEARLPAMIGQDALDKATEAFVALVEARRRIIETHKSLDQTREQIGLSEVDAGDSVPKVPGLSPASAERLPISPLRAVA